MDSQVEWKVSEDFEGLLEAIMTCKRDLTKCCFAKFGAAKILEYKVSAPQKVCDLLLHASSNTPITSKEHDLYCHKAVADFEHFRLFKTKLYGDSRMLVEAKFDVGEGIGKFWYGDVTLT